MNHRRFKTDCASYGIAVMSEFRDGGYCGQGDGIRQEYCEIRKTIIKPHGFFTDEYCPEDCEFYVTTANKENNNEH